MSIPKSSVNVRRFISVFVAAAALLAAMPGCLAQAPKPVIDPATGLPVREAFHAPPDSPLGKVLPEVMFDQTPMPEVVKTLRDMAPGANIVIDDGVENVRTPKNLLLHNVTVADTLTTLASLVEPHLAINFGDGKIVTIMLAPARLAPGSPRPADLQNSIVTRVFSFRGIMLHDPRDLRKPSGYTQQDRDQKAAIDELEFREFVDRQLAAAITVALDAQRAARTKAHQPIGPECEFPEISSHVATRLVIISGDYRAVEVAAQVIDAMGGGNSAGGKIKPTAAPILLKPAP